MDPVSVIITCIGLAVPIWILIFKGVAGIFNKITDGIAARASRPKEPRANKRRKK